MESLEQLLSAFFEAKQQASRLNREAAIQEEKAKSLESQLLKLNLESGTHGEFIVTVKEEEVPFGNDWAKITAYIKETGSVDLLEKRLLKSGVKARWADGVVIPGVIATTKTSVKVEKS